MSDPIARRREFATETGAQIVLDPISEDASDNALRASDGGFDIAFEASGAPPALRQALHLLRPGGTVVQVGSQPNDVELPVNLIMKRELRLVGSFRFAYVFPAAIELAASGLIDLPRLVTRTFSLDQFDAAMSMALTRDEAIKVHLATGA
jgi:threonine dehydrogenase-like Zn-dependent dehydrogenase